MFIFMISTILDLLLYKEKGHDTIPSHAAVSLNSAHYDNLKEVWPDLFERHPFHDNYDFPGAIKEIAPQVQSWHHYL